MNSFEINKILESFDGNRNIFEGVFASDKLPKKRLRKTPSAFIVNLSPSNEIGSHFPFTSMKINMDTILTVMGCSQTSMT